ncbi:MAG: hypothetical protein ACTSQA_08855, partial [Candidatus Heimdallarchaeaceae archaeon]
SIKEYFRRDSIKKVAMDCYDELIMKSALGEIDNVSLPAIDYEKDTVHFEVYKNLKRSIDSIDLTFKVSAK